MLRRTSPRGFSLIELMIVVAVVSILAAIAYPSYVSHIAKGKRAECRGGLLQSMQQQERYFTQFNSYAEFTSGATTAKTKAFSGEKLDSSACKIEAVKCTAPSSPSEKLCIELRALPTPTFTASSSFTYIYLDSDGNRGCEVSGTRTTTNKTCWP